jgi:hypothetical protein
LPVAAANAGRVAYCVCAAEEPLLNAPGVGGEVSGEEDADGDETEPLPGDEHYPLLERKMQLAYERLVSLVIGLI